VTSQRVIPVEPLVAERYVNADKYAIRVAPDTDEDDGDVHVSGATLAEHFMPAEPLEALLAAVAVFVAADEYAGESHGMDADGLSEWERAIFALCAAYRAYVEAKP
jgi:FAD/FMN-containing dehydrogenase